MILAAEDVVNSNKIQLGEGHAARLEVAVSPVLTGTTTAP
jgi:hypothetical protein